MSWTKRSDWPESCRRAGLLMAPLEQFSEIMIRNVIAIPHSATVLDACEFFVLHKFFAFPLVDAKRRMVGIVDVGLFTEEVFDIAEREQIDGGV